MRLAAHKTRTRRGFSSCGYSGSNTDGQSEILLQQEFNPATPNKFWAGDITYIRTSSGSPYLAVWIDLYSHRVSGWATDAAMKVTLVLEVRNRALATAKSNPLNT